MRAIEIGRRMAQLGHPEEACGAFALALTKERDQTAPVERMEAAVFLFQNGGDYRTAYDAFLDLYREGAYREEIPPILTEAFYEPNARDLRRRYEKNRKLLRRYPYLSRKELPAFEDLPVRWYPFDEETWVPFDTRTGAFGEKLRPRRKTVSRNFFRDRDRPVLASDVWSQYELEYLTDNVRRSEDVGRENHIYLHYTDWEAFCSALTVLDLRPLLSEEKVVFLIGDEIGQYPIDFKERFGIDYGQYPLRPVRIREVRKLIWHIQLSAHNGGDYFNEIFDAHPDLLTIPSVYLSAMEEEVATLREALRTVRSLKDLQDQILDHWEAPWLVSELYHMKAPSDKDLMVALYLGEKQWSPCRDPASRFVPAVFFQPHFHRIRSWASVDGNGTVVLENDVLDKIRSSPLLGGFKYVKSFTPIRRPTTSCGASIRFLMDDIREKMEKMEAGKRGEVYGGREPDLSVWEGLETPGERYQQVRMDPDLDRTRDVVNLWAVSRGAMWVPGEPLFQDSVVVRFEDAKLFPRASFTRLAAFLDLPYTDTMGYCSSKGEHDPRPPWKGTSVGFDTASVYKAYDDYMDEGARTYLEYFLRDVYREYGYDFQYWDGGPVDMGTVDRWIRSSETTRARLDEAERLNYQVYCRWLGMDPLSAEDRERLLREILDAAMDERRDTALGLLHGRRFTDAQGRPLGHGRLLRPDPALLDGPLYH